MVKKKPGAVKKRKKRKSRRKNNLKTNLKRTITGVAILLLLVVAAGLLIHYIMTPKRLEPPRTSRKMAMQKKPAVPKPPFEIYPKKDVPPRKPLDMPKAVLTGKRPKISIIIDDLGYDKKMAQKFIELDDGLTFSILPYGTFQREIVDLVMAKGVETMLHLPMEPFEYPGINPGEGALLTTMTPDQLIDQLNKNLDAVPNIRGVNNHMGSKMTTNSTQLYQIFTILKKRGLYFIDSRTTAETLCKPSARLFQLSFSQRDVFLDNVQEDKAIRKQLKQLILIAESHGEAIGIGHPHPATYEVLREMLPELKKKVDLVPASAVVHAGG
jgi:polysaccharide deacetylase 2 family uncharacterized protein YibQ